MNYLVTLSIFFFSVQVQSAIIGGRARWHGNEGLQDESIQAKRHKKLEALKRHFPSSREETQQNEIENIPRHHNRNEPPTPTLSYKRKRCSRYGTKYRNRRLRLGRRRGLLMRPHRKGSLRPLRLTPRVLLGAGSARHNFIVGSPRKSEINKKLCEQCRHSKVCEIEGNCRHCAQYCNTVNMGSTTDTPSSEEELGVARDPENDIFRVEDQKDRTMVSKMSENSPESVEMMNKVASNENEQIDNKENEAAVVRLSENLPEKQQRTSGEFHDGFLGSTIQEPGFSQISRKVGAKPDEKLGRLQGQSRYYVLGMIDSSLLLNILSRLTRRKEQFFSGRNHFERAIILVKSSTPIKNERYILDKIGDSTFLKKLEDELNIAEENQQKRQLTGGQIDKIIQIAHEKAEAFSKDMKSHIVGIQETPDGKSNNETVGCSKEHSETVPFYPIQPNLYRSGSVSQSGKNRHMTIVEPEEFENSEKGIDKKQSKNPQVIQDNPNIESRSNTPKSNDKVNNRVRAQIFDTISDELKKLENSVGSKKNEAIKEGSYMEKQKNNIEKGRKVEQLSREQGGIAQNDGSEEDSVEENDEARTFHKKKKMNKKYKKKGGYYAPSYGYGNSYGHYGQGYGHFVRDSLPAELRHNYFDKQVGSTQYIDEDVNQLTNVDPNSVRSSKNFEDFKNERKKPIETNDNNHIKLGVARTGLHNPNDIDQIIKPDTNIELDRKKNLAAKPDNDSSHELSNDVQHVLHADFDNIHKKNDNKQNKNEEQMPLPRTHIEINDSSRSRNADTETRVFSPRNKELGTKGKYYTMSDSPTNPGSREMNARIDSPNNKDNRNMMKERLLSTGASNVLDGPYIGAEQLRELRESIESNESFDHNWNHPSDNGLIDRDANEQSQIFGKDVIKGTLSDHSKGQLSLSVNPQADNEFVSEQQKHVANDINEMNPFDRSQPGKAIIGIDKQLVDVPKERQSIFQKENTPKFANTKETNGDVVGEAPIEAEENFDEPGLLDNIVGDQNMPSENLKVNPQIMSDESGQNLGFVSNTNKEKPEFSSDNMIPSKISSEIPKANMIPPAPAPAYGDNRKIEIDIPNFMSAMEQEIGNMDFPSEVDPKTEIEPSTLDKNRGIVGNAFTGNDNEINSENIDKIITPQEREFLHNFGKIIPTAEDLHLNGNADVYFMGNGIKLPLKVSQGKDGSLDLSVDLEKLCECKNATCSHKRQLLTQLDNQMGKIFNDSEISLNVNERDKSTNIQPGSMAAKTKRSSYHTDFSQYNGYINKNKRLQKRSIDESSKKNNLRHNNNELTKIKRKMNSKSYLQNSLFKESNDEEIRDYGQLQDLHKFKKAEKQLEEKLEKLNEDVQKSSEYYNNMLQKGTKDLLQIKGEDHVVKQRIELVNDLLKWMKEIAESMATSNKGNATVY